MKYRIKEKTNGFGSYYYPQYKRLLFWHCYSYADGMDVNFLTLGGAKGWLSKKIPKTSIIIHEYENLHTK